MTQYLIKALANIQTLSISTPGIKKLLNNNPHKATGPDNISDRDLKVLKKKLHLYLTLYLHSLSIQDKHLLIGKQQMSPLPLKRRQAQSRQL